MDSEADLRLLIPMPLPDEASPNWRGHYMAKYRAFQQWERDVFFAMMNVNPIAFDGPYFPDKVAMRVTIHLGKGRKKRNIDNATAQCKPLLDFLTRMNVWVDDRMVDQLVLVQDRQTVDGNKHYPEGSVSVEIWDCSDRGTPVDG